MNPNETYTQNDQPDDVDKEFNEYKDQRNQEKVPQTQQTSKRSESSHKSQSRPNSKAASISQQLRSRSNPRTNKSWISVNPFVNFMFEFRKSQSRQRGANMFRLGGEQWGRMSEDEKQPYIEAANKNKKLKQQQQQSEEKKQQKQQKKSSIDQKQYRTRAEKNKIPNKRNSSRKTLSPQKRKERQKHHEAELKKKRVRSDTDTDTDTSGSIHNATTDCPSEDSDNNS